MVSNYVENSSNPLMNRDTLIKDKATFWQSILDKYEERNLKLSRKQLELENRLQSIKCLVPTMCPDQLKVSGKVDAAQSLLNRSNATAKADALDSSSFCNSCESAQATRALPEPRPRSPSYNPKTHLTLQNSAPFSSYLSPATNTVQQDKDPCCRQLDLFEQDALANEKLKSVKAELLKQCMKRLEFALNKKLQEEQSESPMLNCEAESKVSSTNSQMRCVSNILTELTCTCNSHMKVKNLNDQLIEDAKRLNARESLSAMGDNKKVGNKSFNATNKESLNTIARQLSKTLLEMEKCQKCRQVNDDVKHTVKCIKCLLDILHKLSLKKQDRTVAEGIPQVMPTSTEYKKVTPENEKTKVSNHNTVEVGTDIPIIADKETLNPQYHLYVTRLSAVEAGVDEATSTDVNIQFTDMTSSKNIQTSHSLLDELEITASKTGVTDADSELKLKLCLQEEADTDVTITFTVDSCGVIREVLTEGPNGIVNSILYYTDSGTVDIVTEIMTVPESGYDKVILQGLAKPEILPPPCPGGITLLVSQLSDNDDSSRSQPEEKKKAQSDLNIKFNQKTSKKNVKPTHFIKTPQAQREEEEDENQSEEKGKKGEIEVKSASTSCETLYTKSQLSDILESLYLEKVRNEKNKVKKTASLESISSTASAYADAVVEPILVEESSEESKVEESATTYASLKELTIPTWASETTDESRLQKLVLITTATETDLSVESFPADTVIRAPRQNPENLAADSTTVEEIPTDSEIPPENISADHTAEDDTRSLTESLSGRGLTLEDIVTEEIMDNDLSSKDETSKIDAEEVNSQKILVLKQPLDEEITGKASLPDVAIDSPHQPTDYWKTVCSNIKAVELPDSVRLVRRHTSLIRVNSPVKHSEYWTGLYSSRTKTIFSTKKTRSSSTNISTTKIFESAKFRTETESSIEEIPMFHKCNKELKNVTEHTDMLKLQFMHDSPQATNKSSYDDLKKANITLSVDLAAADLYSVSSSGIPSVLRPTNGKAEAINVQPKPANTIDETLPCSSTSEATYELATDTPTFSNEAKVENNKLKPKSADISEITLQSRRSLLTDDSSTETDFRTGVVGALQKANQDVMDALEQANKYVTEALEKVNKDVNSALALATKNKAKKKRQRKHQRRTPTLEAIPQEMEVCSDNDTSGYLPDTEREESDAKSNVGAGEQLVEEKSEASKREVPIASSTRPQSPRTSLTLKSQSLYEKLNRVTRQKVSCERRKKPHDKSKRTAEPIVEGGETIESTSLPNTSFAKYEISRFLKSRHYGEAAMEIITKTSAPDALEKQPEMCVHGSISSKTYKVSEDENDLETLSPTEEIVSKEAPQTSPKCESPSTENPQPTAAPKKRSKLPVPVQMKKPSTYAKNECFKENEKSIAVATKPPPSKTDDVKDQEKIQSAKTKSPTNESLHKFISETRSFSSDDRQSKNSLAKRLPIRPKSSPIKESVPPLRVPPRNSDRAVKTPTLISRSHKSPAAEIRKHQDDYGFLTYLNDRSQSDDDHYKTQYIKPRPSKLIEEVFGQRRRGIASAKQNREASKQAKRKSCESSAHSECYDCTPSNSGKWINVKKSQRKRKSAPSGEKQRRDKDSDSDKRRCRSGIRIGAKGSKRCHKRGLSSERSEIKKQLMIMFAREGAQMQAAENAATQKTFSVSETDVLSESSNGSYRATKEAIGDMLRSTTIVENEIRELETEAFRIRQKLSERQCKNIRDENLQSKIITSEEERTFQNSLNRLQSTLATLRNKCKLKDNLISTMSEELRLRRTSKNLEMVLEKLMLPNNTENYHRSRSPKTTRQTPQQKMNLSYPSSESAEVHEMCMSFPQKSYKRLAKPKKQIVLSKSSSVSSEGVSDCPPLQIIEIRQIGSTSLLVKWTPFIDKNIAGYEIIVNGEIKTETLNNKTTSAILHPLTLKDTVNVSVYAVHADGQYFPPATARYKVF